MTLKFFTFGALALCTSLAAHAAPGASDVANGFIDALQHHRYGEAAAMFDAQSSRRANQLVKTIRQ